LISLGTPTRIALLLHWKLPSDGGKLLLNAQRFSANSGLQEVIYADILHLDNNY
jgi:hypothetical protein